VRPLDRLLADVGQEREGTIRTVDCRCASGPGWWEAANIVLDDADDARARAGVERYLAGADHMYDPGGDTSRRGEFRLLGFRGEIAASKATGLEWGAADGRRPDLIGWGKGVEVRSTGMIRDPGLPVYWRDKDSTKLDRPFILAVVDFPVVRLLGFAWGDEVVAHGVDRPDRRGRWLRVDQLHRLPLHPRDERPPIESGEYSPSAEAVE